MAGILSQFPQQVVVPRIRMDFSSPYELPSLAAWYSARDSANYTASSANAVSFMRDLSGNSGTLGLVLPGASGNYATTPNSAALQITGDIDMRAQLSLPSWSAPAGTVGIVSKWISAASQNSYLMSITTDGKLHCYVIRTGPVDEDVASTAALSFSAYSVNWVRVTRVAATGVCNFYTSQDGVTWAQLGNANVAGNAGSIITNTTRLEVGAYNNAASGLFSGIIYRAQIYNGIAGTLAFDANFTAQTYGASNGATFTESSSNAATVTITGTGALGARIAGARDLAQLTGANRPLVLPWSGANYAWSAGVASNTVTAPTKSVTGSQTITFSLRLDDYTPASNVTLIDKLSGNNGFQVLLLTTGVVRLRVGDGSAVTNVDSTVANTITDANDGTLGIAWTDGVGASFTQNGSPLGTAVAAVKTLTDSGAGITIGPWSGRIYSVTIGSVYRFDASQATNNAASFVSSTGETWTINSTGAKPAQIVGVASVLFDGSAWYLKTAPFTLNQPETVYLVGKQVTFTDGDSFYDGGTFNTMRHIQKTSSPNTSIYAGGASDTAVNTQWTMTTNAVVCAQYNGASSLNRLNRGTASTGNPGSNSAGGFTLAADANAGSLGNFQFTDCLIYAAAHDTATQNRIIQWLANRNAITV